MKKESNYLIGLGIAIGTIFGVIFNNIGVGIALGSTLGIVCSEAKRKEKDSKE